jgi:hypothetical protein
MQKLVILGAVVEDQNRTGADQYFKAAVFFIIAVPSQIQTDTPFAGTCAAGVYRAKLTVGDEFVAGVLELGPPLEYHAPPYDSNLARTLVEAYVRVFLTYADRQAGALGTRTGRLWAQEVAEFPPDESKISAEGGPVEMVYANVPGWRSR